MPELPEVETVVKYLNTVAIDKEIKKINVRLIKLLHEINPEIFEKNLKKRMFKKIYRRGKYLFFILDDNKVMVSHLRMEGKYIYEDKLDQSKHDHIIFHFSDGTYLKYNDTRQFGTIHLFKSLDEANNHKMIKKLGVEPLSGDLNIEYLAPLLKKSNKPIKTFLLDQTKIVGIGNIYANEILFDINLNPKSKSSELSKKTILKLINSIIRILTDSIKHNGTTIHSFKFDKWSTGDYQNYLKIHGKKKCSKCNSEIKMYFVGQRGTYSCSSCQKGVK